MPDYGHDIEFGYFLLPDHGNPQATLDLASRLDDLGYDLIGIQDHPYHPKHYDAMALIAMILGRTSRVRLFPDVASLPLRQPALLAKSVATLDELSGGRFELGLGSGAFWDGIAAMGGPRRSPAEAVESLEEAVEIIRAIWSGSRGVRISGEHYQVSGVQPGPVPARDIGIWLGVLGPRMLRLTGRIGDGWVPSMAYRPPADARDSHRIIDDAAREAGRDPADIVRVYNISGSFSDESEPFSDTSKRITGTPEHWADVLTSLATGQGFSKFVLWADPDPETLKLYINEVAPAVRERVAANR